MILAHARAYSEASSFNLRRPLAKHPLPSIHPSPTLPPHCRVLAQREREEAHRNTNESTNARLMWFSLASIAVVLSAWRGAGGGAWWACGCLRGNGVDTSIAPGFTIYLLHSPFPTHQTAGMAVVQVAYLHSFFKRKKFL